MQFLSEEWLRERARLTQSLPASPGVTVRIQHTVTEAPEGIVQYFDHVEDGRLARWGLGIDPEAEVTIVNEWADELAVLRGEIDMMDVLQAGRVIVLGDQGRLLGVVPILRSEPMQRIASMLGALVED